MFNSVKFDLTNNVMQHAFMTLYRHVLETDRYAILGVDTDFKD